MKKMKAIKQAKEAYDVYGTITLDVSIEGIKARNHEEAIIIAEMIASRTTDVAASFYEAKGELLLNNGRVQVIDTNDYDINFRVAFAEDEC